MLEGLFSAAAGMSAQQQQLDAISNDLANLIDDRLQVRARRASATCSTTRSTWPAPKPPPAPAPRRRVIGRSAIAGRAEGNRQPARPGDRRRRLLPGDAGPAARSSLTRDGALRRRRERRRSPTPPATASTRRSSCPAGVTPRELRIASDGTVTAGTGKRLGQDQARHGHRARPPDRRRRRPARADRRQRRAARPPGRARSTRARWRTPTSTSPRHGDDDDAPSATFQMTSTRDPDREPDDVDRQPAARMSVDRPQPVDGGLPSGRRRRSSRRGCATARRRCSGLRGRRSQFERMLVEQLAQLADRRPADSTAQGSRRRLRKASSGGADAACSSHASAGALRRRHERRRPRPGGGAHDASCRAGDRRGRRTAPAAPAEHRGPPCRRRRRQPAPARRTARAHERACSPAAPRPRATRASASEVLAHLDAQIASARGLLGVVLEQGAAIRARDVQAVVRLAGILRGEMGRRQLLEEERARLLARCGERLGVAAEAVTLEQLSALMSPPRPSAPRARSAELQGLLHELQREHSCEPRADADRARLPRPPDGRCSRSTASAATTPRGSSTSITRARPHGGAARPRPARLAMSIPTLQGLQTALSGLLAEQQAMDVTGHNIANANTEGYSRETAVLQTNPPIVIPALVGDHRRGRAARHGRERRDLHAHPQRLPRRPVPHAEQRARAPPATQAEELAAGAERLQRAVQRPASPASCRPSGARGTASPTRPRAKPPRRAWWPPGSSSRPRFNQLSAQLSTISAQATAAVRSAHRRLRGSRRTTPTRSHSSTARSS